jgi:hypothetical protein
MATQIEIDATAILRVLASAPRDEYIEARALANKTGLLPDRINDAVSLLVDSGYAHWNQGIGTAPFDFGDAIVTARGRLELQRLDSSSPPEPSRGEGRNAGQSTTRLCLFISHASGDADLAGRLVQLVRAALNLPSSTIRCTSVDGYRLPGGADTDERLRAEVHDAETFVGVISADSMRSPYVLFELGARWGARKHLVPVLAPGTSAAILGGPLTGLNALRSDNAAQLHQLVAELAAALGVNAEAPAAYQYQLEQVLTLEPRSARGDTVRTARDPGRRDRVRGLIGELEFNRRVAAGAGSDAQGCAFRDDQFTAAVSSGVLSELPVEVQSAINEAYVATGAATRLVEAAWEHPKGGNAWAEGVNEASRRIREAVPLIDRAVSALRSVG